jgi:hypothetical protein
MGIESLTYQIPDFGPGQIETVIVTAFKVNYNDFIIK